MKKIFAVLFALTLILSMAMFTTTSAEETKTWTGTITIEGTDTVPVTGKTFNAYQILIAQAVNVNDLSQGVVYSIPEALKAFYNGLCGGDDGVATVDEVIAYLNAGTTDLQDFAKAALAAAKGVVTPTSSTIEDGKALIKNLAFGYYVIEDASGANATPISALMLKDTATTVKLKADKPFIKKNIDGATDGDKETNGLVDYNTATVGETVPYVLTSKVPEMTGYETYTFTVTDTFSEGLTYKYANDLKDGISIKIGDLDYTDFTANLETQVDGTSILTIDFNNFINQAANAGKTIVIKYAATVDADAVFGVEGNPNTAKLTYSSDPYNNATKDTVEDTVYTYLVDLAIFKTDGDDLALPGAIFIILDDEDNEIATGTSGNDGWVEFTWANGAALKNGETYTIVEKEAPQGYNKAKDITFTVTCTNPTGGNTACTWTATGDAVAFNGTTNRFETTIQNLTGSLLPETGGIGTTIFYAVGGLLMVVAFVLLVSKKRMGNYA